MRYRKLRIAWSVVWAVAAFLFVGLSVRSQNRFDGILWHRINADVVQIYVYQGQLSIVSFDDGPLPPYLLHPVARIGTVECFESPELIGEGAGPVFGIFNLPIGMRIEIPAWFLILGMVLLAPLPWIHWRFSLRTLLIATTLFALVLGLAVWAARA
jgi:predicted secreted protein